jgi:hypothetical protein
MKQHLRTKYEKYRSYNDDDLERSILSFLNEYVLEMKHKEGEGGHHGHPKENGAHVLME